MSYIGFHNHEDSQPTVAYHPSGPITGPSQRVSQVTSGSVDWSILIQHFVCFLILQGSLFVALL